MTDVFEQPEPLRLDEEDRFVGAHEFWRALQRLYELGPESDARMTIGPLEAHLLLIASGP